jgi:hypothetical protein
MVSSFGLGCEESIADVATGERKCFVLGEERRAARDSFASGVP